MKTEDDYIVAMTVTDYQEEEIEEISEVGTNDSVSEEVQTEETKQE